MLLYRYRYRYVSLPLALRPSADAGTAGTATHGAGKTAGTVLRYLPAVLLCCLHGYLAGPLPARTQVHTDRVQDRQHSTGPRLQLPRGPGCLRNVEAGREGVVRAWKREESKRGRRGKEMGGDCNCDTMVEAGVYFQR